MAKQLESQTKKSEGSLNNAANLSALKDATKPRNHAAFNPLLKKGGVHEKDNIEAVRKKKRRETKKILRQKDWLSEI
ncbi:hypothetical protein MN210_05865 [Psychrobacter raelei]|uniref:Uncharacterized protein n=1 Tax=Psychrobacter raelei TaxID=2565531 RepID=A0AAT9PGS4_9GAMM